jgi:hypothetical protein
MEQREAIEAPRHHLAADVILPDLNLLGVNEAALVQSQQLERRSNDSVHRVPIFNVEEVDPLTKYLRFVIPFNSQALFAWSPPSRRSSLLKTVSFTQSADAWLTSFTMNLCSLRRRRRRRSRRINQAGRRCARQPPSPAFRHNFFLFEHDGLYYWRINTDSANFSVRGDEIHRRATGSIQRRRQRRPEIPYPSRSSKFVEGSRM